MFVFNVNETKSKFKRVGLVCICFYLKKVCILTRTLNGITFSSEI